jgi:ribose transport system ATP-binding protein
METGLTSGAGKAPGEGNGTTRSGQPLLVVTGLTKAFAGTLALDDVDLEIGSGEVHALLGENGSGKSTLIKTLSGYHQPDAGSVSIAGNELTFADPEASYVLGARFIHQDLGLVDDMSIVDNLLLNSGYPTRFGTVRDRLARRRARVDLERVGLDLDPADLVSELTPAQRTGVAVARALRPDSQHETRLLVLDEPTATLPESEVLHLLDIVRAAAATGVAVLYVTHRLDEVPVIADNLTVLRDGRKTASRAARGISRGDLIHLLVGSEFEEVANVSSSLRAEGDPIIRVSGLAAGRVSDVSFDLFGGEVTGVAGVTGSGREALLSAIFGATQRRSGEVTVGGSKLSSNQPPTAVRAGVGYVPAERKVRGGIMELTARENLTIADLKPLWRPPKISRRRERAECDDWFERLAVRPAGAFDRNLNTFSGGNQQKVLLAKWLRRKPKALLLDEPTQGVDIGSKAEIHRCLVGEAGRGAAVLIASSDVDELAAACTRVIVMRNGRIAADLEGEDVTARRISRESLGTELVGSAA